MKNASFLLCILLFTNIAIYAQVGVGTVTPRAELEVSGRLNGGGFLVPQCDLLSNDDVTTVTNPQGGGAVLVPGTIIYNTTAITGVNAIAEGLVYWNGSTWELIADGSANNWKLSGNEITATDFLGTTNAQPLNFRVENNVVSSFLTNETFAIGVGASVAQVNSMAVGRGATGSGINSTALGQSSTASGDNSLA